MSRLFFRKKVLLAKLEVTEGVDPTPTGAANAILTRDLAIELFQGNTEEIDYDKSHMGNGKQIYTGPHSRLTFTVDLQGSGSAGTAPAWGPLLKACGFGETVNAGVDVTYALKSDTPFSSLTLYMYLDGELHEVNGARGTVTLDLSKEALPKMNFTFTGLRVAPVAGSPSGVTMAGWIEPTPVTKAETLVCTLDSYAIAMETLSIDVGNNIVYRNLPGIEQVVQTDRATSGSISFEKPALGDKNFDALVAAHTVVDLAVEHGSVAGKKVRVEAKNQITNPSFADSDGIVMFNADLRMVPTDTGNDELKIIAK
jgi:hypothetical protein